ncbi:MAG: MarR family transcriptional regulator [Candidatus Saccharibacteria bacterium]|nr:MarR family transcriptional regulator [Candidatus Saccharibacteria bacterium]
MSGKSRSAFERLLQATQVDRKMRQRAHEVTKTEGNVTVSEWLLLSIISRGPRKGLTMSALSNTLLVTRPQISALIDGLLAKRLVRQKKGEEDKRSYTAHITERGKDTLNRVNKAIESSFHDVSGAIPDTHLQIYEQVQEELIRKS